MAICCSKVGDPTPLPPPDREETYHDLHMYLKESFTYVDKLQKTFAVDVIESDRLINILRKQAGEEHNKSNEALPLSDKEARAIVKDDQEEKDWLIGRQKIFEAVLVKLLDVRNHEPCFVKKHKDLYDKLISKIKTDVLTLLDERIKYIENKPNCSKQDTQRSKDSRTDMQSKDRDKDSKKCHEKASDNESNSGVKTDDKSSCSERQKLDYKLLYECTLTLNSENTNFLKIYVLVIEGNICKIL